MQQNQDTVRGFWLALSGYILWGVFPIYFYVLREVSAPEVLTHRIIWSMILLLGISYFRKSNTKWYQLAASRESLIPCVFSALFLSLNWLIFIWAVANGNAIEGSLGYFINPLVSIVMAVLFLGERLNKYQLVAICCAIAGVAYMVFRLGEMPWIALTLAFSFGTYGLIHKRFAVNAFAGLTLETIIVAPLAIGYLVYLFIVEENTFLAVSWQIDGLLLLAGVITTMPLLLFLASLPQLRLSTVGLLQYTVPTLQMLVAIYILGETFNRDKLIAFSFIWLGLLVFSYDIFRQRRLKNQLKSRNSINKSE